jgi:hypothetical protein
VADSGLEEPELAADLGVAVDSEVVVDSELVVDSEVVVDSDLVADPEEVVDPERRADSEQAEVLMAVAAQVQVRVLALDLESTQQQCLEMS